MKINLTPIIALAVFLFSSEVKATKSWYIVNDSVMGGLSTNQIYEINNNLIFTGTVSLKNNGGFASARVAINTQNKPANQIALRVKGDGKTYQLRLRTDQYRDGPAYTVSFDTLKEQWQFLTFKPNDFILTFRGRTLQQQPTLHFQDITQLGLMIAKKQQGNFKLEINKITFEK